MERFNLRKQIDVEVKQQHQAQISDRFAAMETLGDDDDDDDDDEGIEEVLEKI
jgi:hypothetical protein